MWMSFDVRGRGRQWQFHEYQVGHQPLRILIVRGTFPESNCPVQGHCFVHEISGIQPHQPKAIRARGVDQHTAKPAPQACALKSRWNEDTFHFASPIGEPPVCAATANLVVIQGDKGASVRQAIQRGQVFQFARQRLLVQYFSDEPIVLFVSRTKPGDVLADELRKGLEVLLARDLANHWIQWAPLIATGSWRIQRRGGRRRTPVKRFAYLPPAAFTAART